MTEVDPNAEREAAVADIVALMRQHHITPEELHAQLNLDAATETGTTSLVVSVLSYIGGIFVFAGIAIFIGLQWEGLNSAARVIITLGPGVSAFAMAALAFSDERYQRAAMPLLLISAVLQPTGMMVAFAEYGGGDDAQVAAFITAATFALQFGLALRRWPETVIAWLTVFFVSSAFGLGMDLLGVPEAGIALALGLGWLSLGSATLTGRHTVLSPQLYVLGSWSGLWGLFDMVEGTWAELLYVIAACGLVYLGVWARSRALNIAATVGLLAYTAYFTGTYFADSIGWPIALILIGLLMIGISAAALQIDRRYLRKAGQPLG